MSFIPVNVTGAVEPKAVNNGRYNLSISSAEEGTGKESKKPLIVAYIAIEGHPDAPNIRHSMSLPHPDDEPKTRIFKDLLIRRFLEMFSIPYDERGFDTDEMVGATCPNAEVRLTEVDEKGNQYNELVLRKMKTEGAKVASVPRPPAQMKSA